MYKFKTKYDITGKKVEDVQILEAAQYIFGKAQKIGPAIHFLELVEGRGIYFLNDLCF